MFGLAFSARADGPAYPVPNRLPQFQLAGILPTVELEGLDLEQGGVPIVGPVPAVEAGTPLDITLYLRPIGTRVRERKLRVNLRPPGVEPAPGFIEWFDFGLDGSMFREYVKKTYRMELPRRRFVGRGVLTISEVDPQERDWQQAAVLHTMPIDVPARVWPSKLDDSRLDGVFSARAARQHAAFTLGPGTRVTVPIEAAQDTVADIGILSNVSWHEALRVGDPLCRVTLHYSDGSEHSAPPVVFGESTYKALIEVSDTGPETVRAETAWVEMLGANGDRTRRSCTYKSVLPLAGPRTGPTEIVFDYCAASGLLDVYEVVVVEGPPPQ